MQKYFLALALATLSVLASTLMISACDDDDNSASDPISTDSTDVIIPVVVDSILSIPEAVDLGLPSGLLWASFNLGTTAPEDYGDHYAWGETETKETYDWSTYKWCEGNYDKLTKYVSQSQSSLLGNEGFYDDKITLDPADDVAHVLLGGPWRMPTIKEFEELYRNCTWTWTTQKHVNGYLVQSKTNSNSVFLSAGGTSSGYNIGSYGYYWSSSLFATFANSAHGITFHSSHVNTSYYRSREAGFFVRPVCVPQD